MGAISKAASSYEDNISKSELKDLFGGVSSRRKAVRQPNVSKYMVSVRNASTGLLLQALAVKVGRFCKRHQEVFVWIGFGAVWFIIGLLA